MELNGPRVAVVLAHIPRGDALLEFDEGAAMDIDGGALKDGTGSALNREAA